MSKLAKLIETSVPERLPALWDGPSSDSDEGGVSQSMLSRYVTCPERFRIGAIEGLDKQDEFRVNIEYGHLWHICEEYWYKDQNYEAQLLDYASKLCEKYPLQQEEIVKWWNVCKLQFPIYLDYWKKNDNEKSRIPVMQEYNFRFLYTLPSGRQVLLRGKWDGIDLIGPARSRGLFLQENKTKSEIDEMMLLKQLKFDLQTMMYLCTARLWMESGATKKVKIEGKSLSSYPLLGVRYNVIKRPLSGGKGSIRPHAAKEFKTKSVPAETMEEFYERLTGVLIENSNEDFKRWTVNVSDSELDQYIHEFLNPVLENLIDDYEWWNFAYMNDEDQFNYLLRQEQFPYHIRRHWRLPYGVYNPIVEGRSTTVDDYLETKSTIGLVRKPTMFRELI